MDFKKFSETFVNVLYINPSMQNNQATEKEIVDYQEFLEESNVGAYVEEPLWDQGIVAPAGTLGYEILWTDVLEGVPGIADDTEFIDLLPPVRGVEEERERIEAVEAFHDEFDDTYAKSFKMIWQGLVETATMASFATHDKECMEIPELAVTGVPSGQSVKAWIDNPKNQAPSTHGNELKFMKIQYDKLQFIYYFFKTYITTYFKKLVTSIISEDGGGGSSGGGGGDDGGGGGGGEDADGDDSVSNKEDLVAWEEEEEMRQWRTKNFDEKDAPALAYDLLMAFRLIIDRISYWDYFPNEVLLLTNMIDTLLDVLSKRNNISYMSKVAPDNRATINNDIKQFILFSDN